MREVTKYESHKKTIDALCDDLVSATERTAEACTELENMCRGYSRYITAQRHFLSLLADNGIGHLLYESIRGSLMECGCFLAGAEGEERRCAANFAAGALTGVAQDYVAREACTEEELGRLLARLFSGSFFA